MSLRFGKALKSILVLLAAVVVACVAFFLWLELAPRRVPSGQPPLATLDAGSLPSFRDTFNATTGEVRILAMLSPT